jgi:hypothetical protein
MTTPFQRAVGVRYSRDGSLSFPDSRGGYGDFGPYGPRRHIVEIFKNHVRQGPFARRRITLNHGHQRLLRCSTGYALLWMPHIRYRTVAGSAYYVGSLFIKDSHIA